MERYSEYKDSGVKWLGEIPSHWELRKMKYTFDERSQKGFPNEPLLAATQNHGVILKSQYENRTVEAVKSLDTLKLVEIGDFVISLRSFQGGLEYAHNRGIISPAYTILTPTHIKASYFKHLSKSDIFISLLKSSVTGIREGQNIDYNKLKESLLPIPSEEEQKAMGCYLDAATSKIDKAIAMQQKMIDLLNERKQIIIQNAVTKGLDENVEMKDSNCKFLGKIPSTWEVCKTLYVLSMPITDGPHTTPQLYDDGIPFVSAEAVSCGNGYIDFSHIRGYISDSFYNECCKKYIPQRDDIYMIKSGATTGKVAIVNTDVKFTIWSPLAVFRVNKKKVLPYFLYYSLQSSYYQLQVQDKWSFGTQQNIGMRMLEKLILCYPSIEEQAKIVAFIKKNVDNFDSAISNSQRQIALLQERKQIIINEVITGKVKVS